MTTTTPGPGSDLGTSSKDCPEGRRKTGTGDFKKCYTVDLTGNVLYLVSSVRRQVWEVTKGRVNRLRFREVVDRRGRRRGR